MIGGYVVFPPLHFFQSPPALTSYSFFFFFCGRLLGLHLSLFSTLSCCSVRHQCLWEFGELHQDLNESSLEPNSLSTHRGRVAVVMGLLMSPLFFSPVQRWAACWGCGWLSLTWLGWAPGPFEEDSVKSRFVSHSSWHIRRVVFQWAALLLSSNLLALSLIVVYL